MLPIHRRRFAAFLFVLTVFAGCGAKSNTIPTGTAQPDKFLFDQGNEALKNEDWLKAREYFQRLVNSYPQSLLRADAKLAIGDTYLGEGSTESALLAANEFREFLSFYPTSPRADYAQYKLAMSHAKQMRAPERDQSETRAALKEFDTFFERYPNSPLTPEVKQRWREARDRLSAASFRVGIFYYRSRWYPGAIDRFREVLREDPGYTGRDAVYFYLAESLARTDKKAEAVPYFERIAKEFDQSEYLDDAQERLQQLKNE